MGRLTPFVVNEWYHLYNRGTDKRKIFLNKKDRDRFLALLYIANGTEPVRLDNLDRTEQGLTLLSRVLKTDRGPALVDIGAYCLMPNHIHLLVREKKDGGISRFMQKLTTAYTIYFNTHYERTGALFAGTFKSTHADDDRYLKYLVSYIHLNPIKLIEPGWKENGIRNRTGAEKLLETYSYSSFLDYQGVPRPQSALVIRDTLLEYCESSGDFRKSVADWLSFKERQQG